LKKINSLKNVHYEASSQKKPKKCPLHLKRQ
jgi:hypothetical protein